MHDQIVRVVGVDRIDGDAGAGARMDRGALEADRLVDAVEDALGHAVDVLAGAGAVEDHDEFVAAEPHAKIRCAAGFAHALRRHHQHVVAGGMAERVVDLLEAVEVELHHRQPLAAPVRALDQRVEMIGKEGAVVQAGQSVMNGDEGHRIARIDQFVRAPQDHVGHRPEDEERDQHDDADGRVEQHAVHAEHAGQPGVGLRLDASAKRGVAGQRRFGDGLVETRAFLAGQIAEIGPPMPRSVSQRRDEAPAIGGQARRKVVEMERLGEQHALDRDRIEPVQAKAGRRRCVQEADRSSSRIPQLASFSAAMSAWLLLARRIVERVRPGKRRAATSALLRVGQRSSASSRCCAAIICCRSMIGGHRHRGDDQQRDPVGALDQEDQPARTGRYGLLRHAPEAACMQFSCC